MKSFSIQSVLIVVSCVLAGCNNSGIGSVSGTVHLDGKPLEGAMVTFYPQLEKSEVFDDAGTSAGKTNEQGIYELVYDRENMGAKVGEHVVYIETLEEGGGGDYGPGKKERVPKRYNSESKLRVKVAAGRNTIDFKDLTSDGEKNRGRNLSSGRY